MYPSPETAHPCKPYVHGLKEQTVTHTKVEFNSFYLYGDTLGFYP